MQTLGAAGEAAALTVGVVKGAKEKKRQLNEFRRQDLVMKHSVRERGYIKDLIKGNVELETETAYDLKFNGEN